MRQAEGGTAVADVYRQLGISDDGDDCAAFFPAMIGPKSGPISGASFFPGQSCPKKGPRTPY